MSNRSRRSVLCVPASDAKAIAEARSLECDVVVLDLENAVAPESKEYARGCAMEAVRSGGFGRRELVIRTNGIDTPWGADDLAAVVKVAADAVLVPKISDAKDIARYEVALWEARSDLALWAMIETTRSICRLDAIGAASEGGRLAAWVLGTGSLAEEMGATHTATRAPFFGMLGLVVATARSYGLAILDGAYNDIENLEGFEAQCNQARECGFDGKALIHPLQVPLCNAIFSPVPAAGPIGLKSEQAFRQSKEAGQRAIPVPRRANQPRRLSRAERSLAVAEAVALSTTIFRW